MRQGSLARTGIGSQIVGGDRFAAGAPGLLPTVNEAIDFFGWYDPAASDQLRLDRPIRDHFGDPGFSKWEDSREFAGAVGAPSK